MVASLCLRPLCLLARRVSRARDADGARWSSDPCLQLATCHFRGARNIGGRLVRVLWMSIWRVVRRKGLTDACGPLNMRSGHPRRRRIGRVSGSRASSRQRWSSIGSVGRASGRVDPSGANEGWRWRDMIPAIMDLNSMTAGIISPDLTPGASSIAGKSIDLLNIALKRLGTPQIEMKDARQNDACDRQIGDPEGPVGGLFKDVSQGHDD